MSDITISIGGRKFGGWLSYNISSSIEKLVSKFSITVTDITNQANNLSWLLRPQETVSIKSGDDLLITGYIDSVSPSISSNSHLINIQGRSKTSDLVDCSANQVLRKFTFNKTNIVKLALALCDPFGINVQVQKGTDVSQSFRLSLNAGESAFAVLDRKAKELSILLYTDNKGTLIIGNAQRLKTFDNLQLGKNILRGNSTFDYTNRFSEYKVIGQSSQSASFGANISISASAIDEGVNRFRPLLIQGTGQLNKARAQLRVNWEANTRAANSQTVNIIVQGHRQSNNELWTTNKLVQILAPALYINPASTLLITEVNYFLDESGSFTELSLKSENAYIPDPTATVKKTKKLGFGAGL